MHELGSVHAAEGPRARLLLVCQGESGRAGPRQLGGADVLLNATGREQSRAIHALLHRERIDAVYTSSLPCAVETILPVALERSIDLILDDDLRQRTAGEIDHDVTGHLLADADLGESLAAVREPGERFLGRVRGDVANGRTVVVVAHRTMTQMLLLLLGAEPHGICCGSVVEVVCVSGDTLPQPVSVTRLAAVTAAS
jgi:broad specificity phosphatase PhoE